MLPACWHQAYKDDFCLLTIELDTFLSTVRSAWSLPRNKQILSVSNLKAFSTAGTTVIEPSFWTASSRFLLLTLRGSYLLVLGTDGMLYGRYMVRPYCRYLVRYNGNSTSKQHNKFFPTGHWNPETLEPRVKAPGHWNLGTLEPQVSAQGGERAPTREPAKGTDPRNGIFQVSPRASAVSPLPGSLPSSSWRLRHPG